MGATPIRNLCQTFEQKVKEIVSYQLSVCAVNAVKNFGLSLDLCIMAGAVRGCQNKNSLFFIH